uniref:NADH-ubiquinone oxidoreductase chain 5 n=1 Tax=Potamanthellus edmundsi TaxID=2680887 RepID=A0A8K1RAK3_9INSE|nr:NADH dehydrogenase subunit 5 [Potamanthellus edmundsi]
MIWSISLCLISFVMLLFVSLILFMNGVWFLLTEYTLFVEWEVLSLNSTPIVMTLLVDWMSLIFMSFVLLISSLVIYYSEEYMAGDNYINRFILLVLMFVLSMMLLIISPNMISILLGWDGLGLVSYCLVIYYQNVKSYNAGMLTALSNRIGDVALLMGIAWLFNYGSFNYIFYMDMFSLDKEMLIVSLMVVLAAMTKSAQIPFSAWLPAAMAAPTPVSALVHSSTLVTAGVYLLIRFNNLIIETGVGKWLLLFAGLTMFMAGLGANFEYDLKKIIALSTLSQLGLMMSILSLGFYKLAYFHLLTHALFKALLFMCAGAVIHNMKDSQDIRNMGSLVTQMPYTTGCLNVANLSLCGTPFLAGFYSKDLILEMALLGYMNFLGVFLFFFSTGLTVSYTMRLVYYSMSGIFQSSSFHPINDESFKMSLGMSGLLLCSVFGGSMLSWLIFPTPILVCLPLYLKTMALSVSLMGGWLGYELSFMNLQSYLNSLKFYGVVVFSGSMWFMPMISTLGVVGYPLQMGLSVTKSMDMGWSEYLGGQNLNFGLSKSSQLLHLFQDNNFKVYLMSFILWIIFILMFSFM